MTNTKKEIAIIDNLNNERVATLIEKKEIENEIEEQRVLLQTYLASDMDIDEMDYNEVVNYAIYEVTEQNEFIRHWKDYAFLRGKLEGSLSKEKEMLDIIDNFINKLEFNKDDIHERIGYLTTCLYKKDFEELKQKLKGEQKT